MSEQVLNRFVIPLRDITASPSLIGENGVNLARLSSASLPIPPGFFISSDAYLQFAANYGLFDRIQLVLSEALLHNLQHITASVEIIQQLFINNPIPPEISNEIHHAFDTIENGIHRTIIQGSVCFATFPDPIFSDSFHFFQNASGLEEIELTIRKCWASIWTPQTIQYLIRFRLPPDQIQMAVIVQEKLQSDTNGIMLTVNPENGRSDRVIIDTFEGEKKGSITPTYRITVHKKTGKIIHWKTASKEIVTIRSPFGVYRIPVHPLDTKNAVLENRQASNLAKLGMIIENLLHKPVTINWEIKSRDCFIIQVHPINDYLGIKKPWTPSNSKSYLIRSRLVELFPDPITPIFETMGIPALLEADQRMRMASRSIFHPAPLNLDVVNGYIYQSFRNRFSYYLTLLYAFLHTKKIIGLNRTGAEGNRILAHSIIEKWENEDLTTLKSHFIYDAIQKQISCSAIIFADLWQSFIISSAFCELWARLLFDHELFTEKFKINQFEQKFSPVHEYFPNQSPRIHNSLDAVSFSLDFGRLLRMDQNDSLMNHFNVALPERNSNLINYHEKERYQKKSRFLSCIAPIRKKWFLKNLGQIQQCYMMHEDLVDELREMNTIIRKSLLELGNRIKAAGAMENAEDIAWIHADELAKIIFHLDLEESPNDYSEKVQDRKAVWKQNFRFICPEVIPMDTRWMKFCGLQHSQFKEIKGFSVQKGQVTAPACVIRSYEDFIKLRTGDVIVVTAIIPAWMPLIARASAIVTDYAGMIYDQWIAVTSSQIPIVVETKAATRIIQTGQIVTVNGDQGTVRLG